MFSQLHRHSFVRNCILRSLSPPDFNCIRPLLQPVTLKERLVLHEPNKHVEYVNFIETGVVSLMTLASGSILETALVGCHGVVGVSVALGAKTSAHRSIVLVSGSALRIRADELRELMHERPQIHEHLLRYVQSLMTHGSQMALCGVRHELEQRLACWLCLACDALGSDVLPITHEHLSMILGLRRAGVTEALSRFENQGLVQKKRGVLQLRERGPLEKKACGCYGIIANAYDWTKAPESSEHEMHFEFQTKHNEFEVMPKEL
jgi:CRP-like cAMP-binding protein